MGEQGKHAPGPWSWTYSDAACTRPIALDGPDGDVLLASEDDDGPRAYVSPENAALIAAAPGLLEVVRSFVALFRESDMRPEDECNEMYIKATLVLERIDGIVSPPR